MEIYELVMIFFVSLILFCYFYHEKNGLPTNWPFLGMLPLLLLNVHRAHEFCKELVEKSYLTFIFKGPWFTNMKILITSDPANIHHIMSKNFTNYPKGAKFNEMFDVLGDGIFNADYVVWQYHRKMAHAFLTHPDFHTFLIKKTIEKVNDGLIPVLNHASDHNIEIDLQDVFARFTFDAGCTIMMDHDPRSLSTHFPFVPPAKALDDIEHVIFSRHVVPSFVWKLQKWLNIGSEKKYKKAWQALDKFIFNCIATKKENMKVKQEKGEVCKDLLTIYLKEDENHKTPHGYHGDKFIRDTVLTNFIAGRDATSVTLSWFFYLLAKNPKILSKIKEELENVKPIDWNSSKEINNKLVYLHGALCEALRLYSPVGFETKNSIKPDILPSGHHVTPNMQIVFNLYAMGRMKAIWGDDCDEFKPERWITEQGKTKHEPSYKFFVFNAGPRTCLGKEMAFTQMKVVAATIIQNYVIQPTELHRVVPHISIFLRMKYGFKVRVLRST